MVVNFVLNNLKNWILDSGAIDHIIGNKNLLNNFINWITSKFTTISIGGKIKIIGSSSINLFSKKNIKCSIC
jgi:hypothetical protein